MHRSYFAFRIVLITPIKITFHRRRFKPLHHLRRLPWNQITFHWRHYGKMTNERPEATGRSTSRFRRILLLLGSHMGVASLFRENFIKDAKHPKRSLTRGRGSYVSV